MWPRWATGTPTLPTSPRDIVRVGVVARSGSAGRRRSTARSAPCRGWCGRARSTPPRSSGPSTSASTRAGLARAARSSCTQCGGSAGPASSPRVRRSGPDRSKFCSSPGSGTSEECMSERGQIRPAPSPPSPGADGGRRYSRGFPLAGTPSAEWRIRPAKDSERAVGGPPALDPTGWSGGHPGSGRSPRDGRAAIRQVRGSRHGWHLPVDRPHRRAVAGTSGATRRWPRARPGAVSSTARRTARRRVRCSQSTSAIERDLGRIGLDMEHRFAGEQPVDHQRRRRRRRGDRHARPRSSAPSPARTARRTPSTISSVIQRPGRVGSPHRRITSANAVSMRISNRRALLRIDRVTCSPSSGMMPRGSGEYQAILLRSPARLDRHREDAGPIGGQQRARERDRRRWRSGRRRAPPAPGRA